MQSDLDTSNFEIEEETETELYVKKWTKALDIRRQNSPRGPVSVFKNLSVPQNRVSELRRLRQAQTSTRATRSASLPSSTAKSPRSPKPPKVSGSRLHELRATEANGNRPSTAPTSRTSSPVTSENRPSSSGRLEVSNGLLEKFLEIERINTNRTRSRSSSFSNYATATSPTTDQYTESMLFHQQRTMNESTLQTEQHMSYTVSEQINEVETIREGEDPNTQPNGASIQSPIRVRLDEPPFSYLVTAPKRNTSLRDYTMLAQAANRANKVRMEGQAVFHMARIYEERAQIENALLNYRRFLKICRGLGDAAGEVLVLNILGVLHQTLGGTENLNLAVDYHGRHTELAESKTRVAGFINLGLAYNQLGDVNSAAESFKQALQQALEINDRVGENIAVANLGLLGKEAGDYQTAQVCLERHLVLSRSLKDAKHATDAYHQLGMLATDQGDFTGATVMLHKARTVAVQLGDQDKANQLKCSIAFASGNVKFDQHLKDIATKLSTSPLKTQQQQHKPRSSLHTSLYSTTDDFSGSDGDYDASNRLSRSSSNESLEARFSAVKIRARSELGGGDDDDVADSNANDNEESDSEAESEAEAAAAAGH